MPDEWEALLADAAVAGRMVYQVKQLNESLTGRVAVDHLRENSFGSLVPARGYFHLKSLVDLTARAAAPAGRAAGDGGDCPGDQARQPRPGAVPAAPHRAGRQPLYMLKFRTMAHREPSGDIDEVITGDGDARITRVGAALGGRGSTNCRRSSTSSPGR